MQILIADDDPMSSRLIQRALIKFGYDCRVAYDGEEAWAIYRDSDVDVIISDCMMPKMDGVELCRRVRGFPYRPYTYFIFLTALGGNDDLLGGIEAGADDYITKPLDPIELKACLISASRVTSLHHELGRQRLELERLNHELADQARKDPLTALGNRLRLREDLEALQERVRRYGQSASVALCDIDFFKGYNDFYGHLAGDEALVAVGAVIRNQLRVSDSAYRYGGEEFLIMLPEQSLEDAAIAMERLRSAVEGLNIQHKGQKPPGVVTLSIGIAAISPADLKSADSLLKEADVALYYAKSKGRNRVTLYNEIQRGPDDICSERPSSARYHAVAPPPDLN